MLASYIVNEVQDVYRLQGAKINDKHIEVIVRHGESFRGPSRSAGRTRVRRSIGRCPSSSAGPCREGRRAAVGRGGLRPMLSRDGFLPYSERFYPLFITAYCTGGSNCRSSFFI
ncbi:hypothetical protein H0A73_22305 [Alcaligenaceae bacterium]|nr:hypothetical protein [Alcaligenaceae bacterium]